MSLLLHMSTCLYSLFFFPSLCPKSPLSWLSLFSKFYPGEPNPITRALKGRVLSLAGVRTDVAEGEVREIRSMRRTLLPLLERATWKARGICGWPLGAKTDPPDECQEGIGPQSYHHEELNPAQNLNELGSRFPGASRKRCGPTDTLILIS